MKKHTIVLLFIFTAIQAVSAQDLGKLMSDYAKSKDAEYNIVTQEMLSMASTAKKSDKNSFIDNVTSIESLDLEDCSKDVKNKFIKEFGEYKDGNGFETFVKVQDEEDKVSIIVQKENNIFKNIYIIAIEDSEDMEIVMVKMSGNFSEADLKDIIKDQNIH